MRTLEYRFADKSDWGEGPWQSEPDKKQWIDAATGFPCLIVRNRLGALCGYVGVPRGHHAYEKDNDAMDVEVHGGLTFSSKCQAGSEHGVCHKVEPGEDDDIWWLGFDCAHSGDIIPGMEALDRKRGWGTTRDGYDVYRDQGYVEAECASLARQLSGAGATTETP